MKHHYDGGCARRIAELVNRGPYRLDADDYAEAVDAQVGPLELKDRELVLARELRHRLPPDYVAALTILVESLGPELREDQGYYTHSWFLSPVARFVEEYGLDHPGASLAAIEQITRRHTGEFAIRPYLVHHYEQTMAAVQRWAGSPSHNVRRLASEGLRPRLPWHARFRPFIEDPTPVIAVLDRLVADPSGYVRTSVANNLNDISKDHPHLALTTARRWLRRAADPTTIEQVVSKGLRGLIKAGDPEALALIGAQADPAVSISAVELDTTTVRVGEAMVITATVVNAAAQRRDVVVDYRVHFRKANGDLRPTTFKLGRVSLEPGQERRLSKRHWFKRVTTRTYYPGAQALVVLANGRPSQMVPFTLQEDGDPTKE